MKSWLTIALVVMVMLLIACGSDKSAKELTPVSVNPNGDSELALLMRQMGVESDSIRVALLRGEVHPVWSRLQQLHTATPTDSTVSGPVFEGFASAFIHSVKQFEASDSLKTKYFNAVVDGCMQCHREFCPGPMKRIAKLYLTQ
jgi:hypothetical protein